MKKVTMQDIADALNISRVSVWKVFTGRPGVSPALRNQIIAKALEMNYALPSDLRAEANEKHEAEKKTIAIAVSSPETSVFWINLIHEIAKEASAHNANIMYTYLPKEIDSTYTLPSFLTDGSVNGMIVLNVYDDSLIKMLASLNLPKVFMDTSTTIPFAQLNGDLLLIEGRSSVAQITESIIAQGKKRIGFIGDIKYAQTNFERYYGFKSAMKEHGISVESDYCLTGPIGADTYKEEIERFLDKLAPLPDAFICVSDFVANIVCNSLVTKGFQIPKDIMVSGFDEQADLSFPTPLTTVRVNSVSFGCKLARQILYRLECPNAGRELIYVSPEVVLRESTKL